MFIRYLVFTYFLVSVGLSNETTTLEAIEIGKQQKIEQVSLLNYKNECGQNPLKSYRKFANEHGKF
jgi:hypothetical protein